MGKDQLKKPVQRQQNQQQNSHLKKMKQDKLKEKLKDKLRSAIFNQTSQMAPEVETKEAKIKYNPSHTKSTNGKMNSNAATVTSTVVKNKSNHINKIGTDNQQNNAEGSNRQKFALKKNGKHETKTSIQINTDSSHKLTEFEDVLRKEKSKKKAKNKKKTASKEFETLEFAAKTSKPFDDHGNSIKLKRKVDETKVNTETSKKATKRLKIVDGFVETNADNDDETKRVTEKLMKKKPKLAKVSTNEDGPKIKVYNVKEDQIGCSAVSNSDSENDSYIDKFFRNGVDDFDENRIYSLDEIESKQNNDFLSKASGANKKRKKKSKTEHIDASDTASNLPTNKLINYKNNAEESGHMAWPEEDEYTDSDYDYNMMYGTDSEISLGSEVSDSTDTYECESTDIDSSDMDEYEDDASYEPSSYSEHGYGENESASSGDTYDDFLHSRYYDDNNSDSSNDHEYKGEIMWKITFIPNFIYI